MKLFFEIILPVKTISEANVKEHWTKTHKRKKIQKNWVMHGMSSTKEKPRLPCQIKLTRLSSRKLDSDNLQMAFKHIRDEIASYLIPGLAPGRADADPRLDWQYAQEKSKEQKIKIEILEI
jgi:hypothetical protein